MFISETNIYYGNKCTVHSNTKTKTFLLRNKYWRRWEGVSITLSQPGGGPFTRYGLLIFLALPVLAHVLLAVL